MIDFHLSINQLELAGAICVAALATLSLFKLASGGIRKQIGRLSFHAKSLLGFCIVDSIIVCGTKTNDPPRSAGAPITGKAAKMAAFPVSDGAGRTPVATAIAARAGPCGRFAVRALRSADLTTSSQAHPARGIPISLSAFPVMVTPEDIARGYRVVSVATNETPFAEMPSNAVEYAKWSLRGGYETGGIMELWNYGIM